MFGTRRGSFQICEYTEKNNDKEAYMNTDVITLSKNPIA